MFIINSLFFAREKKIQQECFRQLKLISVCLNTEYLDIIGFVLFAFFLILQKAIANSYSIENRKQSAGKDYTNPIYLLLSVK